MSDTWMCYSVMEPDDGFFSICFQGNTWRSAIAAVIDSRFVCHSPIMRVAVLIFIIIIVTSNLDNAVGELTAPVLQMAAGSGVRRIRNESRRLFWNFPTTLLVWC